MIFARCGGQFLGLAQNLVRRTNRILAHSQRIGRRLALSVRLLQQVHQRAALFRQHLRHACQFGNCLAGFLRPRRQMLDLLRGAFGPLTPLPGFSFYRIDPFGPGLRLAFQPVMLGARLGVSRPFAIDVVAQGRDLLRQSFQHRNGLEFGLGRFKAAAHFVKRLRDAADAFVKAVTDTANQPVFVNCGGANRVGGLWLAKRMLVDKWDQAKAVEEARLIGLSSPALEKFALDYVASRR